MADRPLLIGLTGSIGMGKSTVAAMFADEGVPVFDADATVRALQGPGGPLLPALEKAFPGSTGPAGLDRDRIRREVFGNELSRRRLEAIVHPAVARAREDFLSAQADAPAVLFDIPLLFETGGEARVDRVIVVSAPPAEQRRRLLARPGMSDELFDRVLTTQLPDADKRARADVVIDTGGTLDATRAQVRAIVASF